MRDDQLRRAVWRLDADARVAENPRREHARVLPLQSDDATNVLVVSDGGLGDAIHLLPSLWLVRQNFPNARLHVAIGFQEFYKHVIPWVDVAWPRLYRSPLRNWSLVRELRREHFAAAFSVTWHSCAVFVAGFSDAALRIARCAPDDERHWWHRLPLTFQVRFPLQTHPMYFQQWTCMRQAGLEGSVPEFLYQINREWLDEIGIGEDDCKTYVHFSPFTSAGRRDLPLRQTVELLEHLHRRYDRIAITSDATPSSAARLEAILSQLSFIPWRVFAGTLRLHQFVALVDGARLHMGGDTGGLHVSRLVGTPSVSWFRTMFGNRHWMPAAAESQHRVLISSDPRIDALYGIDSENLLALIDPALESL